MFRNLYTQEEKNSKKYMQKGKILLFKGNILQSCDCK